VVPSRPKAGAQAKIKRYIRSGRKSDDPRSERRKLIAILDQIHPTLKIVAARAKV
jgi:hypothetical protein